MKGHLNAQLEDVTKISKLNLNMICIYYLILIQKKKLVLFAEFLSLVKRDFKNMKEYIKKIKIQKKI